MAKPIQTSVKFLQEVKTSWAKFDWILPVFFIGFSILTLIDIYNRRKEIVNSQ